MKKEISSFLLDLRQTIITAFEDLEEGALFVKTPWDHHSGGGGEIALLRGNVFEKAAVNWSEVKGETFPGQDAEGPFSAAGISLITHMYNPHAPTVHFNLRYIETKNKKWFGGGYDLTPMGITYEEDGEHFHRIAKETLDPFGATLYSEFSQNAKNYFFIPHRKKERGLGGLFFDHYWSGEIAKDLALWKAIGSQFLSSILPIYQKRISMPFTEEEKKRQLQFRGHYVEFNLLYDRGTRFGLLSGGNPEAIFCSLPPLTAW